MESSPLPFSDFSSQQLLEALEKLIDHESSQSNNPWISIDKLCHLFIDRHKVQLEDIVRTQGNGNNLRDYFRKNKCFAVYGTQIPQKFYVALLSKVIPNYDDSQKKPIQYVIKKPWKVDANLIKMLRSEGAKEVGLQANQQKITYQPLLIPTIKSIEDLNIVLMELIKSLTINSKENCFTIAALSKSFYSYYGQPLRSTMKIICPDKKLLNLLQNNSNLQTQIVNNSWQISLIDDLLE